MRVACVVVHAAKLFAKLLIIDGKKIPPFSEIYNELQGGCCSHFITHSDSYIVVYNLSRIYIVLMKKGKFRRSPLISSYPYFLSHIIIPLLILLRVLTPHTCPGLFCFAGNMRKSS